MELVVLEKKKGRLVFELSGADHTLCNALKDELWNDKDVTVATYSIEHPLTAKPRFIIETEKEDAAAALLEASKRLQRRSKDFASAISKL